MPHRTTLLQLVAQQEENLHSLQDYKVKGEGSLTQGLMKTISETLEGISGAGANLIGAISKGLGNATSSVIAASATGLGTVIKALGGIPTIVVFTIEALIIGYLAFDRWQRLERPAPPRVPIRRV